MEMENITTNDFCTNCPFNPKKDHLKDLNQHEENEQQEEPTELTKMFNFDDDSKKVKRKKSKVNILFNIFSNLVIVSLVLIIILTIIIVINIDVLRVDNGIDFNLLWEMIINFFKDLFK